jgi:hypothetical protein
VAQKIVASVSSCSRSGRCVPCKMRWVIAFGKWRQRYKHLKPVTTSFAAEKYNIPIIGLSNYCCRNVKMEILFFGGEMSVVFYPLHFVKLSDIYCLRSQANLLQFLRKKHFRCLTYLYAYLYYLLGFFRYFCRLPFLNRSKDKCHYHQF